MFTVFNTALSGLAAISTAVNVVGNNLANLNTTGYKADTVSFHDVLDVQMGIGQGTGVGIGVGAPQAVRNFTQGSIQQASGAFNAAIEGQGFFVVRDANNQQLFTRAGNFTVDADGHLMTATGQFVQGWMANGGALSVSSAPGNILIPLAGMNAGKPTTTMSLSANLDAGATVGSPSGTYAAPVQVVDSLGATHTLTATFTKTGANKWDYAVTLPGSDSKTGSDVQVAKGSLTFASDGTLDPTTAPVTLKVAGLANGAADQNIDWSLVDGKTGLITQYAQKSGLSATKQDGVLAGQITNVGLADGGQIVAHYSSGQQQVIGQLALAAITNPDSLTSAGNNNLAATPGTSEAAIGAAGSGGRGNVVAGALESSTVDIATEFTNLITFQRSYSADSRVLTTGDEMLQDVLNVKR